MDRYAAHVANLLVGNCASLYPVRPGSMGRPIPGHRVAVVSEAGEPLPAGETGIIAVRRPDPVMFLGYWNNDEATREKYVGDWLLTGDTGMSHPGGYIQFVGRNDDVITSAGYRIGPAEIEDVLLAHPAVAEAAAIGVPDRERGQIVKAYIRVVAGFVADAALVATLQQHVKTRLASYKYPREIEFIEDFPMTSTGKISRAALRRRDQAAREERTATQ